MKNKLKYICIITSVFFILSLSFNFYQYKNIKAYKEELKTSVIKNLQNFAGIAGNVDNETDYAQQYGSIVVAQESYLILSDNNGISLEEWSSSLPGLFIAIKSVMLNDKAKFEKAFDGTGGSELIYKISHDFEDKDSIRKVYELLTK